MFDLLAIEDRLAGLRQEWVARPDKRKIIEIQAKALKIAKDMIEEKRAEPDLFEQAKAIFQ
jgi:hypothetical protein